MNKVLTTGLLLSTIIFSAEQAKAADLNIDSFNTQWQNVEVEVPLDDELTLPNFPLTNEDTSGFSNSIVGGYRNIFVEMTNASAFLSEVEANVVPEIVNVTNGVLSISNDDGVESRTVVTWDGDGEGLGTDLSSTDAFNLDILSIDLDANLTFTVMGNNGETATLAQSNISTIGDNLFDYDDFTVSSGTYTDVFSDVKSIALEISGSDDLDISIDSVSAVGNDSTVVPESSSVLSLLGLIGLVASFATKGKFIKKF
jgi:hypothetical protein